MKNAMKKLTKPTFKTSGNKLAKTAGKATVNPYPISVKYYSRLVARVREVFVELGLRLDYANEVMKLINRYLLTGRTDRVKGDRICQLVFYTLRDEIDSAIERSRRARALAQARREARRGSDDIKDAASVTPPSGKMEQRANDGYNAHSSHNYDHGPGHTVEGQHRPAVEPMVHHVDKPRYSVRL